MNEVLNIESNVIYEYLQKSDKKITVMQGGSRCFYPGQKIITPKGAKEIASLKKGDKVLSDKNGEMVYKRVVATHKMKNTKPSVKIKMKDGTEIKCTIDHKFSLNGEWVPIIDILKQIK